MPVAPPRRPLFVLSIAAVIVALLGWWLLSAGDEVGDSVGDDEVAQAENDRSRFKAVDGRKMLPTWEDRGASLAGTVTDPDGAAVQAAQVCAFTRSDELPSAMRREPACATTDAEGRYRIKSLHPVVYTVSASAPQFQPTRWRADDRSKLQLRPGEERTGIDIQLIGGGVLVEGTVKDAAGGVIEGALVQSGEIWWGSSRAGSTVTRTDEDGRFSLWAKPGSVRLTASAEGYNQGARMGPAPSKTFDIHLVPESVLIGRVVMADTGKPVAGAQVRAGSQGWGFGSGSMAITDEAGRFRIDQLEPGIYKPSATAEIGYGTPMSSVHLGLSETSDEVLIELHPAVTVRGRVLVSGDAEPCTDGWVELEEKEVQRWSRSDRTDPDGSVELTGLLPGTYEVKVNCDGYVSQEEYADVVVSDQPLNDVVWEVDPGRAIRGRVVDATGEPVTEARVRARSVGGDPRAQRSFGWSRELEADGSFELTGLLPGSYEVKAEPYDGHRIEVEQTVEVSADADTEDVVLELPAGGTIAGVVQDEKGQPLYGVQVRLDARGWGFGFGDATHTDETGRFEITPVQVGKHRVIAQPEDGGEVLRKPGTSDDDVQGESVEVVAGETAEVTLVVEASRGSISGRVVDEDGGPVADAFIQAERESDSVTAGEGHNRRSVRWGGWNEQPVLTDQDGGFTLDGLTEDARYTIRAYRKGGGEGLVEHVEEGSDGVQVALAPTGTIAGVVSLSSGGAPETMEVTVVDDKQGFSRRESFFRTEGAFVFERLPPGEYEVAASSPEGDAKTTVALADGAEVSDVKLELSLRVTVRGQVIDLETREPVPAMQVAIAPEQGGFRLGFGGKAKENVTDDQGKFVVENAPTGKARLIIIPRDFGTEDGYGMTWSGIKVGEDDPYEMPPIEIVKQRIGREDKAGDLGYELKEPDAGVERSEAPLQIGLVRPGGPAQAAGLQAGEQILAVDGHEVGGEYRSRYSSLTRVKPGTALTLKVQAPEGEAREVKLVTGEPL